KSAGGSHAMLEQVCGDDTETVKTLYAWFKSLVTCVKASKTSIGVAGHI
ncbi:hypothetical protein AVEN_85248-1, partial [Araneus ventricosus]